MKKSEHHIDAINGKSFYKIFFEFEAPKDLTYQEYLDLEERFNEWIMEITNRESK
jgi:hypothetical protein